MRRSIAALLLIMLVIMIGGSAGLLIPEVRARVRAVVRPEPPPRITPVAVTVPSAAPPASRAPAFTPQPRAEPPVAPEIVARSMPPALTRPTATPALPVTETPAAMLPSASPTTGPVMVNGRSYDAYIAAAMKTQQAYRYSCEFDAAWVILETYGIASSVDELIAAVGVDDRVEPSIEETTDGIIIHGGDISTWFSGSITENFLARATGNAMRKAFEQYGLAVRPVYDRAGVSPRCALDSSSGSRPRLTLRPGDRRRGSPRKDAASRLSWATITPSS